MRRRSRSILPGFGIATGMTLAYLFLVVLIPLALVVLTAGGMTWGRFWDAVTDPRAVASYSISFRASLLGACINGVFGFLVAWVLVRYPFPFRKLVDMLVDLPFALPTAVSGITLTSLFSANGWIGHRLEALGVKVAYTPLGVVVALTFIGLPFVVRTVQPVLQELDPEVEEAAASLGAGRGHVFTRIILPVTFPAILTGFALAFARGLGEYGSVVFISGNMPMRTEIAPLLIMTKLEQFDYEGATAIAAVMLAASFLMLLAINTLQWWTQRRSAAR
jgi:sulfate transport system permease protein